MFVFGDALRPRCCLLVLAAWVSGCHPVQRNHPDAAAVPEASLARPLRSEATQDGSLPAAPAAKRPAEPAPLVLSKGREIAIPAGELRAGSTTGTLNRDPAREADAVVVRLPGFSIDALPYPNDPALPVRTRVDLREARALCEADGKRLCSELEWERACKGDGQGEPPNQADRDAKRCASDPATCTSPLGVTALGTYAREWTASEAHGGVGDALRTTVVRGAPADAAQKAHRCAARDAATPDSRSESLAFRCCRGPLPEITYPDEPELPPLTTREPTLAELRAVLAAMPETRASSASFRPFADSDVQQALTHAHITRSSLAPWTPVTGLVSWAPASREQVRVLSGDTDAGAVILVWYPDVEGRARFITSYETRGEHAPILLLAKPDERRELLFSTCWGCGGEGGAIRLTDEARVRVELR